MQLFSSKCSPLLDTSVWLQETTDERNGFNFVYFLINKGRYVRRDTGSLFFSPNKGLEVSRRKSFFIGFLLPANKGQEVSGCKSFLIGSLLQADEGQEVSGCKLFLGGCFVVCGTVMLRRLVNYGRSWSGVGNAGPVVCDVDWYCVSGLWSCPKCDACQFSLLEVPEVD